MSKKCSSDDENSIIGSILADVNAIIPNFFTLAEGYRLLVGAAEELRRTPDTPRDIFERSIVRCDRAGTLIDILLELLCCKIKFSSEFLSVTCAPVDIIEQLSECDPDNTQKTKRAEKIILIEALRRVLDSAETDERKILSSHPSFQKNFPLGKHR